MLMRKIKTYATGLLTVSMTLGVIVQGIAVTHTNITDHRKPGSIFDNILSVQRILPPPALPEQKPQGPPMRDEYRPPATPPELNLRIDDRWYAGENVTVRWSGAEVARRVRFYFHGQRCRLGGRKRGKFDGVIHSDTNSGMLENDGKAVWKVPWPDGAHIHLRAAAYDSAGERIAVANTTVALLPKNLKGLPDNCIAVCRRRQRLYYIEGGETKYMFIVSTGKAGHRTPVIRPGRSIRRGGRLGQVFNKCPCAYSSLYNCRMYYWLAVSSAGLYGIHSTSPNLYRYLGRPASHGCIRLHRNDARRLYKAVDVGTLVYVP